jgi:CMP-2-keto-3-deoxyoctulosonic acid synthetase
MILDKTVVALIAAKYNSNRFPGKNAYIYKGKPLFLHSVDTLLSSQYVDDIFVCTNSESIVDTCQKAAVKTIWRGPNVSNDEEPLISVLNFGYKLLPKPYDILITIMANCPCHNTRDVENALTMLAENADLLEARGFNSFGKESGLIALRTSVLSNAFQISSHIGMIKTDGVEIHYESDFETLSDE